MKILLIVILFLTLSIQIVFGDNTIFLSRHVHSQVQQNQIQQFYLPSIPHLSNGESLVFVVTPLSGDADLFISTTTNATGGPDDIKGTHAGADIVDIKNSNPRYTTGPYWISVKGVTDVAFTLTTYITNGENIVLDDGNPQLAHVDSNKFIYFKFNIDERSSFAVSTTPLHGDPDIYVSTIHEKPDEQKNDWKSSNFGLDVIRVDPTHPKFKIGEYYVGIKGFTDSLFSIVVSKNTTSELLTEGIPHGKVADVYKSVYFKYFLSADDSLRFEAHPKTEGDLIRICVSTTTEKPEICDWEQYSFGGSTQLVIEKTDPKWKKGFYYITTNGYPSNYRATSLTFQLLGATQKQSTLLMTGIPINRASSAGQYQFFKYYYGFSAENVTISSQTNVGSNTLYASHDPSNTRPTREKHDIIGIKQGSVSSLIIPTWSRVGWYYIGIEPTSNSNITVMASSYLRPIQLQPGRIFYGGSVPDQYYRYFVLDYTNEDLSKDLTVATHPYSGFVGVYASTKTSRPVAENAQWKSGWQYGVVISGAELSQQENKQLYIGVRGESGYSSDFTIVTYLSDKPIVLPRGKGYNGVVSNNQYVNFVVDTPNSERIRLSLTINNGGANAEMYASSQPNPNSESHEYKTPFFGEKRIIIPFTYSPKIYISVRGLTTTVTRFSLRVSHEYEYVDLGAPPILDDVDQGQYKYFQTFVWEHVPSVLLTTTLVSGNTEMFINMNSTIQPNRTHHDFHVGGYPGNIFHMERIHQSFKTGPWAISVYGIENSDFYISSMSTLGALSHGEPTTGASSHHHPAHYYIFVQPNKDQYFNVITFGACGNLYASQDTERPDEHNHKWIATSSTHLNNQIYLAIRKEQIDQGKPFIYLSVVSCQSRINELMRFEITSAESDTAYYVSQEIDYIYKHGDDIRRPNNFFVRSFHHSKGFNIYLQSCTKENILSNIFMTTNTSVPFPIHRFNNERRSIVLDRFTHAILHTGNEYADKLIRFTVRGTSQHGSDYFSIYSTLRDKDPRPICTGSGVSTHYVAYNKETHKSTISVDIRPINSDYYPLTIQIVYIENDEVQEGAVYKKDLTHNNFDTLCGIKGQTANYPHSFVIDKKQESNVQLEFPSLKNYRLNVIITDRLGRQSVCHTTDFRAVATIPFEGFPFSFGTLFLVIFFIIFVAYFVIGVIVNKCVHKKTGFEIIPNFSFWKDLPFLVLDGIKFLFTCGRRRNYVAMVDEEKPEDDKEKVDDTDENPFANTTASAYGTL